MGERFRLGSTSPASSSAPSGSGMSKWQLALVVGVPAAALAIAGTALVLYLRRRRRTSNSPQPTGEGSRPQSVSSSESGSAGTEGQPLAAGEKPAAAAKPPSTREDALAIKQRGNELYKQEKFDEAIKCYEQAIQVCPVAHRDDISVFHQNIAAVYDAMGMRATDQDLKISHLTAVVEHASQALEFNPRYVKALTRRLKAAEVLGRKEDALLDLTRVLLLDETQGKALAQTVARLLKEIGQELATKNFPKLGPLTPTKHLVKSYFDSFSWSDDISETRLKELWLSTVTRSATPDELPVNGTQLQQEEAGEPNADQSDPSTESHDQVALLEGFSEEPFVKAAAMFRRKEYTDITEVLTEAVEIGRDVFVPHALLLRGAMYALWRQDDKALIDLEAVVTSTGLSKEMYTNALVKKAGIYAGQFQLEKCKTCFEKAVAIDSRCADIYVHKARVGLEAEDPRGLPDVADDLEKALKLASESPFVLYSLASTYHRIASIHQSMQLLESARMKFEEAVRKFPSFVDGIILYALFLQDLSDFQKAEELLNKAIKLEPDNPLAHFSLGLLSLMYRQDIESALTALEAAIAVDVSCVQAYDTLASLEMQRGNTAKAMELYEKGIQFSRSPVEMSQAYVAREIVTSQEKACQEYGISPTDLASRSFQAGLS